MRKAILIPIFNEVKSIRQVLNSLEGFRDEFDVVVVDDGSYDGTSEILDRMNVILLRHCINAGYGAALQTGLKYLYERGYDRVILFDGDGQHPAEYISSLLAESEKGVYDIVIGSRFLNGYRDAGMLKCIALRFFSTIIRISTGTRIYDPTSGFKCLNRRAMRYYTLDIMPLSFPDADAMILAIRSGLRAGEYPVSMKKRISGKSMHYGLRAITYMFNMLFSILICILKSDRELKMED